MEIPVVGGKVSFYNETAKGAIKPSPVIGSLGLVEQQSSIIDLSFKPNDFIFIIGSTSDEMGGSEYYEWYHRISGGNVPKLDLSVDKLNSKAVLELISKNLVNCIHDCSKGGLAVAVSEMAIAGNVGLDMNLNFIPNSCSRLDNLLFSESQSRYIIGTKQPSKVQKILSEFKELRFARIGRAAGSNQSVKFIDKNMGLVVDIPIKKLSESSKALERMMTN
jgi:phosphoribosylformylglycinamidine synthase